GRTVCRCPLPPRLLMIEATIPVGNADELVMLLGASGAGKSVILKLALGLLRPDSGRIFVNGQRIDTMREVDLLRVREDIGMLFQETALFPHLSVWRNVAFGLRYRPDAPRRGAERAEALRWLDLMQVDRPDARVDELSGGQRQRVALARTLAAKPRVVLLDEPFSSLDRELRDELGARVKSLLAEQGVAALWVTHDRAEAARLGDQVWQMADGRCEPVP
ncbi:MAG: ATP-binding cassette domain-containing protein, partial [Thermoplasmatota archaeon]